MKIKFFSRRRRRQQELKQKKKLAAEGSAAVANEDFTLTLPCKRPLPLGLGSVTSSGTGVLEFVPTTPAGFLSRDSSASDCTSFYSCAAFEDDWTMEEENDSVPPLKGEIDLASAPPGVLKKMDSQASSSSQKRIIFQRKFSSFIRVADLDLQELEMRDEEETVACSSVDADSALESPTGSESRSVLRFPNFHHMSVDPPPGVPLDPKELWVALDDGNGSNTHAPIAPVAVRALAKSGLKSTFDQQMWVADSKTAKVLKQTPAWNDIVWQNNGPVRLPEGDAALNEAETFVWTGNFSHGLYGSDLPAVRSTGIINMNPKALLDLLVDSSRVKEYNKLCVGRTDLLTLQGDNELEGGAFDGVTKVMKSESKPPMMRTTLQFTSLIHARKLEDGAGYKLVTRAVTLPEDEKDLANTLKSEILMGVTLLKTIEGQENKCLFIAVNHLRSPMVPTMIAKRIGLSAAANFIGDLRGVAATTTD
uniref:START domain-containing protein n=1 Tax=Entomoneis paludosa TaxID=265537 RepID=A0A7S2YIZ2_9STRA|mmetsp:Transcript_34628/g.72063  ORF Transcript_34628/g.72063 Transcript_34628/m.72063 type:complete len:478 (+) Transcript_34628:203-1636(+)